MADALIIEIRDNIMLMKINRPEKKNAFNIEVLRGLSHAYTELSERPDLRCGLVYSEGACFSSGMDMMDVLPKVAAEGESAFLDDGMCDPFRNFGKECKKPIIVAVQGQCYGAGMEFVISSDICVAADDVAFNLMEVRRGIMPLGGATMRLPQLIGWQDAMYYMLTGDTISAEKAESMGLVQKVTTPGKQLEKSLEIAYRIANNAPLGVQAVLETARIAENPQQDIIVNIRDIVMSLVNTADAREGMMSLLEKREPVFTGQ